jgi:hypothetical protein
MEGGDRPNRRPAEPTAKIVDLTSLLGGKGENRLIVNATDRGLAVADPGGLFRLELFSNADGPLQLQRLRRGGISTENALPTGENVSLQVTQGKVVFGYGNPEATTATGREVAQNRRSSPRRRYAGLAEYSSVDAADKASCEEVPLHTLVRVFRMQAGLSQQEFARRAGMGRPRLTGLELDTEIMTPGKFAAVLQGFSGDELELQRVRLQERYDALNPPQEPAN